MTYLKYCIKHPFLWVTLLLIGATVSWNAWNAAASKQRMSPALRELVEKGADNLDVLVELDFKLEGFHLNYFQAQGRVARVKDRQIALRNLSAEKVKTMARNYWISRMNLETEDR